MIKLWVAVLAAAAAAGIYWVFGKQPQPIPSPAYHTHADFAVFIRGEQRDFSGAEFQSTEERQLHPQTHLHDGVGGVMHFHESGITLATFFRSLGVELTQDCLLLNGMDAYCTSSEDRLTVWVNGQALQDWVNYVPADLDRILISYGPETEAQLTQQMAAVADEACIYSEVCPERGSPPTENCVGGLGSSCAI